VGHPFTFTAEQNTLLPLVSFIKEGFFKKIPEKFKLKKELYYGEG